MTKPSWFQSLQLQALHPLPVLRVIAFVDRVLFPAMKRAGFELTALRRLTLGIGFCGLSWVVVGAMQVVLDGGHAFSIAWQVLLDALPALGEVLVSATGLEFADSQAPQAMQGVRLSFWLLSVTIGHLWVLVVNAGVKNNAVTGFIGSTGWASRRSRGFSSPDTPSWLRSCSGWVCAATARWIIAGRRRGRGGRGRHGARAPASLTRGDGCPITHR